MPRKKGKQAAGPTPYQTSPVAGSEMEEIYAADPDALYNDRKPYYGLVREKPEHRVIIYLKSLGLTNLEIGHRVNYTPVAVSNILRQPWARERLLEEIRKSTDEAGAIQQVLNSEVLQSVQTLIDIRDNDAYDPATRANQAERILDRALGKATQRVEARTVTVSLDSIRALELEEQRLNEEEARLLGASRN